MDIGGELASAATNGRGVRRALAAREHPLQSHTLAILRSKALRFCHVAELLERMGAIRECAILTPSPFQMPPCLARYADNGK